MKKSVVKLTSSAVLAATLLAGAVGNASAATWVARTPEQVKQSMTSQSSYATKWGDTLWAIHMATGLSVNQLANMNHIANVDLIETGVTLNIQGSVMNGTTTVTAPSGDSTVYDNTTGQPAQISGQTNTNANVPATGNNNAAANETSNGSNTANNNNQQGNNVTPGNNSSNNSNSNQNNNSNNSNNNSSNDNNSDNNGNSNNSNNNNSNNNGNNNGNVTPTPTPTPKPTPTPNPVDSKVLGVPFISQGSTMLCEGTSLLEALHYKGYTSEGLYSFVNSMPRASDNNPYNGFAGDWQKEVDGTYQGMMAAPVIQWANAHGANATDISGQGLEGIKASIRKGNPVVAWITYDYATPQFKQMSWGRAVWNGHVINVDGFKPGYVHVVDPVFGANWIAESTFVSSFSTTGMAVSVG